MSTTVINTNIMNVISKWLKDNEYIQDKKDIDDEAWDHLVGAIASELKKGKGDKVKDPAAPKPGPPPSVAPSLQALARAHPGDGHTPLLLTYDLLT